MSTSLPYADNILNGSRREAPIALTGVTRFTGTSGTDFLAGNFENAIFVGTAGIDFYAGAGDSDWVDYGARSGQVIVDLTFDLGTVDFDFQLSGLTTVDQRGAAIKDGTGSSDFYTADSVGSSIENVRLGSGHDSFIGDEDDNIALGGKGNDTLKGGDGEDTLCGDDGKDKIYGEGDDDTLSGGRGDDKVEGGEGKDTVSGGDGADCVDGGNNDDTVYGDNGNDKVLGGNGEDTLYGGLGNDKIDGGEGNDIAYLGRGYDTVCMTRGEDGNSTPYNIYISDKDCQKDTFIVKEIDGGFGGFDFGNRDDVIVCFESGKDKIDVANPADVSFFYEFETDLSFLPGSAQTLLAPFDTVGKQNTILGIDIDDNGLDGDDYFIVALDSTIVLSDLV